MARNVRYYYCDHCNKKYKTERGLDSHLIDKHYYHCFDCNKTYKTENGYRKHRENVHNASGCNGIYCLLCGTKFTDSMFLIYHALNSTCYKIHNCLYCDGKFSSTKELMIHKVRTHYKDIMSKANIFYMVKLYNDNNDENINIPRCTICNTKYLTEHELIKHNELIHKKIECKYCDAKFIDNENVDFHVKNFHNIYVL